MATIRQCRGPVKVLNLQTKLRRAYERILQLLEKFPKDSGYRINTEQVICHKLAMVNASKTEEEIVKNIWCGNMKSLLAQAHAELELCKTMLAWKPWEPVIRSPSPSQWKWPFPAE